MVVEIVVVVIVNDVVDVEVAVNEYTYLCGLIHK